MMASAMIVVPAPGKMTLSVAVATRSAGACCTASNGRVTRYATFASRYREITMIVPRASDNGMFLRGSLTSPAVNVMLFQASAEKSEPVCETHIATNKPNAVSADNPGTTGAADRTLQNAPKL